MAALIFDTETTGRKDPGLVEAAWIRLATPATMWQQAQPLLASEAPADSHVQRFNPGKPMEFGAMATHHITNEAVAHCPSASTFRLPAGITHLIGHKIDYDIGVIAAAVPGEGYDEIRGIDTLVLAQRLWPECDSHTQSALLYFLMPEIATALATQAHDAAVDVGINLRILAHIVREPTARGALHPDESWSFDDLWQISEIATVPDTMPFGMHKGKPIAEVPADYWDWYLRQADVDPYLVRASREGGRPWSWPKAAPVPQGDAPALPAPTVAPQVQPAHSTQPAQPRRFTFTQRRG